MPNEISAAEQAYNEAREGQHRHTLIWIEARNRDTGEIEADGFWTGPYAQTFVIDGETRTYGGAGRALDLDDIPGGVGLDIRYVNVRLAVTEETELLVRGYDPRLAPAEIHTVTFNLLTGELIAPPRRVFKGAVNTLTITRAAEGGQGEIEASLASSARQLTRTLPLFRSDAEMRRRNANDRFREHVSNAGLREVPWGEKLVRSTDVAPPEFEPLPQPRWSNHR